MSFIRFSHSSGVISEAGVSLKDSLSARISATGTVSVLTSVTGTVSFILDTQNNKNIIPFVKNSDLLVCESTYESKLEAQAKEHLHLTSSQAAKIAKDSKSKRLVLTHISQRYEKNPKQILDEAKKIFKNSVLVKDLDVVKI